MPVIDIHAHFLDRDVAAATEAMSVLYGCGTRPPPDRSPGTPRHRLMERMFDPAVQAAEMAERGIDHALVSASTVNQYTGWAEPAAELEMVRRVNDRAAEWVARFAQRYTGSFVLPMQDVDLSLAEMRRAVEGLGLRWANLPARVDGRYLGHPSLRPLWEAMHAMGVAVLIHPDGIREPWFQEYSLWNSLGQPIEEAKVMASLIYEGVLDAFPGMTIVVSHGGGFLPHYCGRLDRNVTNMPASARNISRRPSDYLRDFHYDTCVYEPGVLGALARVVGVDRLLMGSDYPVGEADPLGFLRRAEGFTEADRAAMAGGNAARLPWLPSG
ncbi:amidohydrolase [Roseomonas sp. KE2513]|uniref:amidohydrolase family protein n=1 Tax=Roseomonas sp. KE2513 TaxID=2479202 RepID=UPI0018DF3D26|nr:amidohydrolase family protein [Roseomonas sp. KE2513]MBI0537291.1 amidohydrolase [Roseomonas sp. KE2513]